MSYCVITGISSSKSETDLFNVIESWLREEDLFSFILIINYPNTLDYI